MWFTQSEIWHCVLGRDCYRKTFWTPSPLNNEVEIKQIPLPASAAGSSVEEMNLRQRYGLNIIAIKREDATDIAVSPQHRFNVGDIIVVIGKTERIWEFERNLE